MKDSESRTTPVIGSCVWCKKDEKDKAENIDFIEVGAEEIICEACLKDCRWFKRDRIWQFIISDELPEEIGQEMFDAVNEALAEVYERHGQDFPSPAGGVSNAAEESVGLID